MFLDLTLRQDSRHPVNGCLQREVMCINNIGCRCRLIVGGRKILLALYMARPLLIQPYSKSCLCLFHTQRKGYTSVVLFVYCSGYFFPLFVWFFSFLSLSFFFTLFNLLSLLPFLPSYLRFIYFFHFFSLQRISGCFKVD